MSLSLLKERMSITGITPRQEMVNDSIFIESLENENDLSYCDTFFRVINNNDYASEDSYEKIHPRLFSRKWSSYKNHEVSMQTTINEPVTYGDMFFNKKDNTYWICIKGDLVDDVHYSSTLLQCNYLMYWQRENNEIVSRYCTIINGSSYSNGESGNSALTILANQFLVYIVSDDITNELDNGHRINISNNINKCRPYDLTRVDDVSYGKFDENGVLSIMFTQDSYNPDNDFLVEVNGEKAWICDYVKVQDNEVSDDEENINKEIIGSISYRGNASIKAGGQFKTFIFTEYDNDNCVIDITDERYNDEFSWEYILPDLHNDNINVKIDNNMIKIKADYDDDIIGQVICIKVLDKNKNIIDEENIEIGG